MPEWLKAPVLPAKGGSALWAEKPLKSGGMAEWLKAPVLKTGKGDKPFVSSNLTPTAMRGIPRPPPTLPDMSSWQAGAGSGRGASIE